MFTFLLFASIVALVLFVLSVTKTASLIPEKYFQFPVWFCWFFLVPVVNIVFVWIMLPFGIPMAIKQYGSESEVLQINQKKLFGLGLALAIVLSMWIPFSFLFGALMLIPAGVLTILYWVEIVKIRDFLQAVEVNETAA